MISPASQEPRVAAVAALRDQIAAIPRTPILHPGGEQSFAVQAAGAEGPEVSFAWYNSLSDAGEAFSGLVERVRALLAQLAPIAQIKSSSGSMSAVTVLRYDGLVRSAYSSSSSFSFAAQHVTCIDHAFALRQAFAAALAAAAGTLLSIAAAAANPLTLLQAFFHARALEQALLRLQGLVDHG